MGDFGDFDTNTIREEGFGGKGDRSNSDDSEGTQKTTTTTTTTITSSGAVSSALVESIEPHATYYLSEVYVEENEYVEEGAYILKYTNGTYLTAPYDCCIISLSLPEESEQITNSHYVQIESTNMLTVSLSVSESQIDVLSVGTEAEITISALEKTYTGYVTNISSTANNGYFTVTVEFENDGDVMIGMSSTCTITIETEVEVEMPTTPDVVNSEDESSSDDETETE